MAGSGVELNGWGAPPGSRLEIRVERWPIRGQFTIARGSKREAVVVVAEIGDGIHK